MNRLFLILSLLIVACSNLQAQSMYEVRQAIDFYNQNKMTSGDWRTTLTENDIKGSPYLNDEFAEGSVFTTSKTQYVGLPLRYNIYNDQVEFKTNEGQVQAIAAPEMIDKVEFGNNKFVYIPYTNAKKIRRGYCIVMEEGNASLYRRPQVVFEDAKEPGAYQDAEPAKFSRKSDEYYIRIGMEQAKLVGSKKDIPEIFPDHKKEVEKYINKYKVKPNKPETLLALVKYYNSL